MKLSLTRSGSDSSDADEIRLNRPKRRKKNPFIDDEAEYDGESSDEQQDDELDIDLDGFIDDSDFIDQNQFATNKRIEIELNHESLLKFLDSQTKDDLENMGLRFVYSHPSDLLR